MSIRKEKLSIPSNISGVVKGSCKSQIFQTSYNSNEIVILLVVHTNLPRIQILFFLLARLNSPFVVPGQYSGFMCQKSVTRRNTPFCCRLLPAIIAGNKQYRPRNESEPINHFLPLRAEPFVGRQSVSSITTKCVTLRGRHHLVPGALGVRALQ
ncbi:hypothetical protein ALC56_03252 [Trachymyrmex septentrionalis]|uniref:Uncharacterized protein n=1 Tax=Trachymyrmex septentrionalis TaxID=34720 RepID=A0A195FQC1_9HYME|nr:hypothetical protein ALC56_03252 [Trachymyrmex septentrionalis]